MKKASIITIGEEILIGQIVDTNSAFLAKNLDDLGFAIERIVTVSDKAQAIDRAMKGELGQVDLVILTGGLGPTNDDVTKNIFCSFFEDQLVINQQVLEHVTYLLEKFYQSPISKVNQMQALVPSKARVLFNTTGTAPGMLMQKGKTTYVSLPGVPSEMKTIFAQELTPVLKNLFPSYVNLHQTMVVYQMGESLLAQHLLEWESALEKEFSLSYLPSKEFVRLRLSISGDNEEELRKQINSRLETLPQVVKSHIRSYEDVELSQIIVKELHIRKKTISFAESCTGGNLAQKFNAAPKSSAIFKGGIIPYATQSKIDVLGVAGDTINAHSVVSVQVAKEMAIQARIKFKSDYAISTTGNAGPSKGDSQEEVGTVCIGIATPFGAYAKKYQFGQPRERVISRAVSMSLELIYNEIIKNNEKDFVK